MSKAYYIHIMTNPKNSVLYVGVTDDLARRVFQHKSGVGSGFTSRYNAIKLVYYEEFGSAELAISREKQLKAGSRQDKIDLINGSNASRRDLYNDL